MSTLAPTPHRGAAAKDASATNGADACPSTVGDAA
jgi:hypothetical protein